VVGSAGTVLVGGAGGCATGGDEGCRSAGDSSGAATGCASTPIVVGGAVCFGATATRCVPFRVALRAGVWATGSDSAPAAGCTLLRMSCSGSRRSIFDPRVAPIAV
jgi:hypothetical protein